METSRNGKRWSPQHVNGWADVIRHQIQRKEVFSEWGTGEEENVRTSPRREEDGTGAWHGVSLSRTSYMSDQSCRVLK